ncbi:MAG TPA: tetratricopeptide repeat protein [Burkholderiales bacterium]|nr:tetratricopeptide repeat protein [Burkholderiales bacterium]
MSRLLRSRGARGARRWLGGLLLASCCGFALAQQPQTAPELTPQQRARLQWEAGYVLHLMGDYERAVELFRASIAAHPTAEAHTYLGWSLSHLGRLEEAIAQCKIAIGLDPDFGNPYNDIGVYLIDQGKLEEAVPWLEKAMASRRYCCYQFPHYNLGRVRLMQGRIEEATRAFERALKYDPQHVPSLLALEYIKRGGLRGL